MIRRFSVMLALVLAAVVSCSGPIDSNDGELTIVVDKTQIESDGKDAAVFKIMRGSVEVSTEDEMGSDIDSSRGSHMHGSAGSFKIMSAVYAGKNCIIARFYAVFHYDYRMIKRF